MTLGNGFEQLGFTGPLASSAMVNAYGLRGTFGLDYALNPCNTVGAFYQTRLDFKFPDAVRFGSLNTYQDLSVSQPETVGLGWANRSLMDGNLLLAADVYYKLWERCAALGRRLHQPVGVCRRCATYPGQTEIPPRLLVQHRSDKPLGGRQPRRISRGPGCRSAIPGGQHGNNQPTPHHRRHRSRGFPRSRISIWTCSPAAC